MPPQIGAHSSYGVIRTMFDVGITIEADAMRVRVAEFATTIPNSPDQDAILGHFIDQARKGSELNRLLGGKYKYYYYALPIEEFIDRASRLSEITLRDGVAYCDRFKYRGKDVLESMRTVAFRYLVQRIRSDYVRRHPVPLDLEVWHIADDLWQITHEGNTAHGVTKEYARDNYLFEYTG